MVLFNGIDISHRINHGSKMKQDTNFSYIRFSQAAQKNSMIDLFPNETFLVILDLITLKIISGADKLFIFILRKLSYFAWREEEHYHYH